ncbi:hypothetical protein GGF46_002482 [Coemansia sp. RSA 552]|nr:hypothetical protein GGF46_002482 [Coemansia sp. RSA 552]
MNGRVNGRVNGNGVYPRRQRRRLEAYGLPEYLYEAYGRLVHLGISDRQAPMLTDAYSGRRLSYEQFRTHAETLAASLGSECGLTAGCAVAILMRPSIDIPVIAVAAWIARVSVSALSPEYTVAELCLMLGQHLPQVLFVSQTLLPLARQVLSELQPRSVDNYRPAIVVADMGADIQHEDNVWGIRDLYTLRPGREVLGRRPQTLSEAEESTAVVYYIHHTENGNVAVTPTPMSHRGVISLHKNTLRRTSSLPVVLSAQVNGVAYESDRSPSPASGDSEQAPGAAFAVLRMHAAFKLHKVMFDIFCKGARYYVSHVFDPAAFADIVAERGIVCAELTFAEISRLIGHLRATPAPQRAAQPEADAAPAARVADSASLHRLASLRHVYTESGRAISELAPQLSELLPGTRILRTHYGSYVEQPI